MLAFIVRRSLLALLTIWILSMISFFIIQLPPGDFIDTYIFYMVSGGDGSNSVGSPELEALGETLRE